MQLPILYGLDTCDTCGKARKWLDRHGVDHRFIDYREVPVPPATLKLFAQAIDRRR